MSKNYNNYYLNNIIHISGQSRSMKMHVSTIDNSVLSHALCRQCISTHICVPHNTSRWDIWLSDHIPKEYIYLNVSHTLYCICVEYVEYVDVSAQRTTPAMRRLMVWEYSRRTRNIKRWVWIRCWRFVWNSIKTESMSSSGIGMGV